MLIKRALVSVFDKRGIVGFARELTALGIELISSGGTAKLLSESGIATVSVSDFTGSPELFDGRIKTLHPKIYGGILADRKKPSHLEQAAKHGIKLIDLVIVNLYPFEQVALKEEASSEEAIENIDIGGPAMLRAAAKNIDSVAVIVNPARYDKVAAELKENNCRLSEETRKELALEVWDHVARYDAIIAKYFRKVFGKETEYPEYLNLSFKKLQDLRYGENPHQTSALYVDSHFSGTAAIFARQLQGKTLSYNNILDVNAAHQLVREFDQPTAVIVKHNNPSGVASAPDILDAYKSARAVDPEAAFGGIVSLNRAVDERLADEICSTFVEVVIAPAYSMDASERLRRKKNLRVLEIKENGERPSYREYRSVVGGLLVQDSDSQLLLGEPKVVTKRKPSADEMAAMMYAWKIAKYVKSNAIVFAKENRAVGIGAGQMKRVDAAKLGAMIARDYSGPDSLKGCAMASDAFFPFRDGIDYAASLGVTAIIQPGGSVNDKEVIAAADEHNMTMLFTGIRHFRH